MIPEDYIEDFEIVEEPSNTYYLDYDKKRLRGKIDGLETVRQSIYKILSTEKYQYPIYDGYGFESADLIGKERSYVVPEIERRITEALMEDDRVLSVNNFEFEFSKSSYHVTFEVSTIFGELEIESEVAA